MIVEEKSVVVFPANQFTQPLFKLRKWLSEKMGGNSAKQVNHIWRAKKNLPHLVPRVFQIQPKTGHPALPVALDDEDFAPLRQSDTTAGKIIDIFGGISHGLGGVRVGFSAMLNPWMTSN